jgi:hypothetical protein
MILSNKTKQKKMSKLIEALQIFLKYGDISSPTHCEHDVLQVGYDPNKVSEEDIKRLKQLGFFPSDVDGEPCFKSYRYGSA